MQGIDYGSCHPGKAPGSGSSATKFEEGLPTPFYSFRSVLGGLRSGIWKVVLYSTSAWEVMIRPRVVVGRVHDSLHHDIFVRGFVRLTQHEGQCGSQQSYTLYLGPENSYGKAHLWYLST